MLDSGLISERDMADVVSRSRRNAQRNPHAQLAGNVSVEDVLAEDTYVSPLRKADCCPSSDGASAMIIATVDKAKEWGLPYAVISGIDHRMETHNLGMRDLTDSVSTRKAAENAGAAEGAIDVAELYAPFSHQEIILARSLGLGGETSINPSGGVLAGNLMMASGLSRVGEVFNRIIGGEARRGLAHATSGPCLQHNLVTVLEKA
jgi:acetyl-CoA acetyltransferase